MPDYHQPPTMTEMETAVSAMVSLWQQVAKNAADLSTEY